MRGFPLSSKLRPNRRCPYKSSPALVNYSSSRVTTLREAIADSESPLVENDYPNAVIGLVAILYALDRQKRATSVECFCLELSRPELTWHVYFDSLGDLCGCLASARKDVGGTRNPTVTFSNLIAPYGDLRAIARRLRAIEFAGQTIQYIRQPNGSTQGTNAALHVFRPRAGEAPLCSPSLEKWYTNFPLRGEFQGLVAFAARLGELLLACSQTTFAQLSLGDALSCFQVPLSLGQCHILRDNRGSLAGFLTWAWVDRLREDLPRFATLRHRPIHPLWNDGTSLLLCDVAIGDSLAGADLNPVVDLVRGECSDVFYLEAYPGCLAIRGTPLPLEALRSDIYDKRPTATARTRTQSTRRMTTGTPTQPLSVRDLMLDSRCALKVPMVPLKTASISWLNTRLMHADPLYTSLQCNEDSYRHELLKRCAVVLLGSSLDRSEGHSRAVCSHGYVDRYGGEGIGKNGGSGRSAYVDRYYLKGVGRSPLIHSSIDETHATGGAYLEECVRETIFSEIVSYEFPAGAIPVLAILDTGVDVVWQEYLGPRAERQAILVRPAFLRPAHGELAHFFIANSMHEVGLDVQRVVAFFEKLDGGQGPLAVKRTVERFADAWARQMAYAFVHRLPHCGNVTSNISLEGALVDFGATSAVPTWGAARVRQGHATFGDELGNILGATRRLCAAARHFWLRDRSSEWDAGVAAHVAQRYTDTLLVEVLRICGLPRWIAEEACRGAHKSEIARVFVALRKFCARDHYTIILEGAAPRIPFDIPKVWDDPPPRHLIALRGLITRLIPESHRELCRQRSALLSRDRAMLSRERAKKMLYGMLAPGTVTQQVAGKAVEGLIARVVENSRRDSRMESAEGSLISGFQYDRGYSTITVSDGSLGRTSLIREEPWAPVFAPLAHDCSPSVAPPVATAD